MDTKKVIIFILLVILTLFFATCPAPFDLDQLSVLQDTEPPVITITTPLPGSEFESTVHITGTIIDCDCSGELRTTSAADYIASASYDVVDDDPEVTAITLAEDGSFTFDLATASYDNQITISLSAEDVNGNAAGSSITIVPDTDGPCVVVTSPEDYSEYATVIEFAGYVTNSVSDTSTSEVNLEASYSMPGTSIAGTLALDAETGGFYSTIDVSSLDASRSIEITASDLNGNTTTAIITILKPSSGGDISGFTVTPGNKHVEISWDPAPFAESYSLFESNYGETRENVTSPYTWEGLENWDIYAFQLTAHLPEGSGSDAVSAVVEKMPLSTRTLAPWVKETGYKSITIEWWDNTRVSSYIVERSLSPDGPWEVRRNLTENEFTDDRVDHDTEYFYRVTPSNYKDIQSTAAAAVPGKFGSDVIIQQDTSGSAWDVAVAGSYAFVADGENGLAVIDISDPLSPEVKSYTDTTGSAKGVAVADCYAFVAAGSSGLAVIDISDPLSPEVKTYAYTEYANDVAVAGSYAFVAVGFSGLAVIDISNPLSPVRKTDASTSGCALGVAVAGGYAFVADEESGLAVIDISNPLSPVIKTYADTSGDAYGVAVAGSYAFVTDGESGLAVIDVSDPLSPEVKTYADTGYARDVAIAGCYAFVADGENGLAVIDISDPLSPEVKTYADTSGYSLGVAVAGCYAFVADYESGLAVVDISDPLSPVIQTYADTSGLAEGIAVAGCYAFVTNGESGLAVIDVSDPLSPEVKTYADTGYAYDVAIAGCYAFVADGENGLAVIELWEQL